MSPHTSVVNCTQCPVTYSFQGHEFFCVLDKGHTGEHRDAKDGWPPLIRTRDGWVAKDRRKKERRAEGAAVQPPLCPEFGISRDACIDCLGEKEAMREALEAAIQVRPIGDEFRVQLRGATGTVLFKGTKEQCDSHRANTITALVEALAVQPPAPTRLEIAQDLLKRAANFIECNAPDEDWWKEYYLFTGEHMILGEEGWCEAAAYDGLSADDFGEILDEVNAPNSGESLTARWWEKPGRERDERIAIAKSRDEFWKNEIDAQAAEITRLTNELNHAVYLGDKHKEGYRVIDEQRVRDISRLTIERDDANERAERALAGGIAPPSAQLSDMQCEKCLMDVDCCKCPRWIPVSERLPVPIERLYGKTASEAIAICEAARLSLGLSPSGSHESFADHAEPQHRTAQGHCSDSNPTDCCGDS
jgi:hypothetical protein